MAREKNLKAKEAWALLLASKTKIPRWRSHKSLPRIPIILYTSRLALPVSGYIFFKYSQGKKFSEMFVIYIFY